MTERLTERQRWLRRLGKNGTVVTGAAILLLLVAAALWLFWRDLLVEAWHHADSASLR